MPKKQKKIDYKKQYQEYKNLAETLQFRLWSLTNTVGDYLDVLKQAQEPDKERSALLKLQNKWIRTIYKSGRTKYPDDWTEDTLFCPSDMDMWVFE